MKNPKMLAPQLNPAQQKQVDEICAAIERAMATTDQWHVDINKESASISEDVWAAAVRKAKDSGWKAQMIGTNVYVRRPLV